MLMSGGIALLVHHLVDQLDLSRFDADYRNNKLGSSVLLKAILLVYL
jgi:hypothetical protein